MIDQATGESDASRPDAVEVQPGDALAKQRTMRLSIIEGSFWSVMQTLNDNYLVPFGLSINMTLAEVGFMNALAGLIPSAGQVWGAMLMERRRRKAVLVAGVVLQASLYPLVALLGILFLAHVVVSVLPIILIVLYSGIVLANAVGSPAWFSMMGDVVPESIRGRYFSKRNSITTLVGLIGTLAVAFVVNAMHGSNMVIIALALVLVVAAGSRYVSASLLTKHYDAPFTIDKSDHVGIRQFFRELPKSNFGHFTLLVALVNFAQMVASPYFTPYMIVDLHFDYVTYAVVNLSSSFIALVVYPLVGKYSDRFGNVLMLRVGAVMIPLIPLFWAFFTNPVEIILVPQVLSGVGWTMFNLATFNFVFDSIEPHKRGYFLAYYNMLIGICVFAGGLVGALLFQFAAAVISFMNPILFVFLLSALLRGVSVAAFLPGVKEIRPVEHAPHLPVFRFRNLTMAKGFIEVSGFEHWYRARPAHDHVATSHHWGVHWGFHKKPVKD
jgi:MFS family permease